MLRLLRIQYAGAICNAIARGVERRKIFGDAKNYERSVHELDECVETFAIRLYAFCLFGTISLIKYGGWNRREVAAELGPGPGAAISMGVKSLEKTVNKERAWRRAEGRIERELAQRLKGGTRGHRVR